MIALALIVALAALVAAALLLLAFSLAVVAAQPTPPARECGGEGDGPDD